MNKESGLAHDENTSVPQDDQIQTDFATETEKITKESTDTVEVKTIADETNQTTV